MADRIRTLCTEARQAGDDLQMDLCHRALEGDAEEAEWRVGDRIEAGHGLDECECGTILEIEGDLATIGWDSPQRTQLELTELRRPCAAGECEHK